MSKVYKYPLNWITNQTVRAKAIKVLTILITNNNPYLYLLVDDDAKSVDVNIFLTGTGDDVMYKNQAWLNYICTNSYADIVVWHWFTDFNNKGENNDYY